MTGIMVLLESAHAELAALSLLHFIWEGAVLGIVAAVFLRALAGSSPNVRYSVACVFLCALALSPIATYWLLGYGQSTAGPLLAPAVDLPAVVADFAVVSGETSRWLTAVLSLWLVGVGVFGIRA